MAVLGGGGARTKGWPHSQSWEEGRKCLPGTCNTRKLVKSFLAVKCFVLGNSH